MDTWRFDRCVELAYRDTLEEGASVEMTLGTSEGAHLRLRLLGVRLFELAPLSPHFWLQEFEIEDIRDRGWEAVNFSIHSGGREATDLRCYCREIEVLNDELTRA